MIRDYYIPEEYTESCANQLDNIAQDAYYMALNYNGIDMSDKTVIYSAAIKFLEKAASYIGKNPEDVLNINNLITLSVTNREDDKGEKAGNIVPVVEVGSDFISIVSGNIDLDDRPKSPKYKEEEYPPESEKALKTISNEAMTVMMNENNVDVSDENVIYVSICRFLEGIALYLKRNKDQLIDLASLLRFKCEYNVDDNSYVPKIEIGERFKLAVKNDDSTEEE